VSQATQELSPRAREIVAKARELLETEGPDALTMRRLAERLGIRAPSLYKHLAGKEELETAVIATGFEESAERFEDAVAGRPRRPLAALAAAYRAFAQEHPHLYRLMTDRPLRRDLLPPGLEARAAAPLVAAAGSGDRARAVWAFAHGMTILELNGRFPPDADLDAAWRAGIRALEREASSSFKRRARGGRPPP
jgi:AcrR family transcriptional regulator